MSRHFTLAQKIGLSPWDCIFKLECNVLWRERRSRINRKPFPVLIPHEVYQPRRFSYPSVRGSRIQCVQPRTKFTESFLMNIYVQSKLFLCLARFKTSSQILYFTPLAIPVYKVNLLWRLYSSMFSQWTNTTTFICFFIRQWLNYLKLYFFSKWRERVKCVVYYYLRLLKFSLLWR